MNCDVMFVFYKERSANDVTPVSSSYQVSKTEINCLAVINSTFWLKQCTVHVEVDAACPGYQPMTGNGLSSKP